MVWIAAFLVFQWAADPADRDLVPLIIYTPIAMNDHYRDELLAHYESLKNWIIRITTNYSEESEVPDGLLGSLEDVLRALEVDSRPDSDICLLIPKNADEKKAEEMRDLFAGYQKIFYDCRLLIEDCYSQYRRMFLLEKEARNRRNQNRRILNRIAKFFEPVRKSANMAMIDRSLYMSNQLEVISKKIDFLLSRVGKL